MQGTKAAVEALAQLTALPEAVEEVDVDTMLAVVDLLASREATQQVQARPPPLVSAGASHSPAHE